MTTNKNKGKYPLESPSPFVIEVDLGTLALLLAKQAHIYSSNTYTKTKKLSIAIFVTCFKK